MLSALLGGIIGGAIGGAIISTVSYAVSCVLSGEQMNGSGLANAVNTGAVSGALGGAIGGITAASKMAEFVAKGIASAGLGLGIGIKTSMENEGTMDQRKWKGRVTGIATFAGSLLKVDTDFFGAMFVNYHTALFFGTPVEVVSVAAQQMISKPKESKAQSVSAVKRTGLSNAGRVARNHMAANKPGRGTPSGFWTSTDYYYLYYGGKVY